MKKLFTSITLMLAALVGMNAQDTSSWTKGQDVTAELEWQDYSGESDNGVWVCTGSDAYDFQEWEMFNNAEGAEFYQIFYLPAGVYTFTCQGFYRGNYQTAYWDGTEQINAVLFAESVTLDDETGEVSEVTRSQQSNLSSIASSENNTGRLFETTEWTNDVSYDHDGVTYYVPNCMEGTRLWFNAGYYNTNSVRVIQENDGYIKVGIRKTATLASDWVIFSNFKATYVSDANEGIKAELAKEDFNNAMDEADALENSFGDYPALNGYYQDAKDEIYNTYDALDTYEGYVEGLQAIQNLMAQYRSYYAQAKTLSQLIVLSEATASTTSYAGLADFQSAIAAAKAIEADGEGETNITTSAEDYATAVSTLGNARVTYEMSKGANADGSYDLLNIVAYPFFCLPQYNPVWNEETQRFESTDLVLNGDGTLLGWSDLGESGSGDNCTYQTTTRVKIADGLSIGSDTTSVYSWYQVNTSGYEPYWNHKLSSAKQWSVPGDVREICQNLTGLPNGYYSLKGMGITWTGDWSSSNPADLGIYIQSSNGKVYSEEEVYQSGWWGYDRNDWTDFTTGMVQVTDGQLRVAFHANGFSSFTGMQLIYYGESPDFTALVAAKIAAVNSDVADKLILQGDQAAVAAILAEIPDDVVGFDAYSDALAKIDEANAYITTASNYLASNDPTQLFSDLQTSYVDTDAEKAAALDPAITYSIDAYDASTTTYQDIEVIINDYNAYVSYFSTVDSYAAKAGSDALTALITEQMADLAVNYADADKLESYVKALAAIYNQNVLNSIEGIENASESNPVDVTALLTNPSFTENNTGWTGDITVDETLENAERYNTNFNIYQTLYSLPAGAYEVRVQAYYRDGYLDAAYNHAQYDEDGGYQENVTFYANDHEVPVVSIANSDAIFTDRSFTEYTFEAENPNAEEGATPETLRAWMEENSETDEETGEVTYTVTSWKQEFDLDGNISEVDANEAWIYDAWVTEGEDRFFFPNSMRGAANRFPNDNGAYLNSVQVMVEEGGDLTIGIRKDVTIDGDWCMFDNFQLFYLGTDTPTGINAAGSTKAAARQYYTVDGRQTSVPQKGINIVKMSDGSVRKVFIK